jgi:cytochrome c oxidase subunit 1
MFILGLQGMPRRYYDYLPQYADGNFFAGFGALFMILGIGLMFTNLALSFRTERNAQPNPWGGVTLEWKTASPPPLHNFEADPEILDYPYDFTGVVDNPNNG